MDKPNVYLFPQLIDNYGYLIKNPHSNEGILVDPSDLEMCLKILDLNDCKASYILLTHHHEDHIGAVSDIKKKFNSIIVGYENDTQIPKPDLIVKDKESFEVLDQKYEVIHTPGHTLQHINYFMEDHNILFTGDTLFNVGCGRMFEGDPDNFWESLLKLKSLPSNTKIYCGHEYTLNNVKFALSIDPDNQDLIRLSELVNKQEKDHRPTIPTTLSEQLLSNPFLRCDADYFMNFYESQNPVEIFAKMRSAKDNF
tara:strand:+ start:1471 stop:2232 length:762 start_codon:yes stop_codon:yes gene_type:complete